MFYRIVHFSISKEEERVKKSILYLFKFCSVLLATFFNMAVKAIEVGDQVKIPINTRVYLDNGSNCKDYSPFKDSSCSIGFGDTVEVLGRLDNVFVLKYLPGPKIWEGKCEANIQTLCFSSEDQLAYFLTYSSLEPEIQKVEEWEKPSKEILGDNHSAVISEGQIFSAFSDYSGNKLLEVYFEFSMESIFYPIRRILQNECHYFYGYRLKVVGFRDEYFAYIRLMEPENEKQVVKEGRYYNCPVGSLYQIPIHNLIETDFVYRESLKIREDFLKSYFVSRSSYNLFEIPLKVDGLTVGQVVWFNPAMRRGTRTKVASIQNIDFNYLDKLEKRLENDHRLSNTEAKSLLENVNSSVFKTIPMINDWSCDLIENFFDSMEGLKPLGHIIGFTDVDSGLVSSYSYSGVSTQYAIVENRFTYKHPPHCKFVLIPTFWLLDDKSKEKVRGFHTRTFE